MEYTAVKAVHVASAILSISGFAVRGVLMLRSSPLLATRFARIAPHVVDTVLLASAFLLAWASGQYPFSQPWLTAKVVALAVYVLLGTIALRRGRTLRTRARAFAFAMGTALYIVSVAITRDAAGPLAFFR